MTAPTLATLTSSVTIGGSGKPTGGTGNYRKVLRAELNTATAVANGLTTGQSVKLVLIPANCKVVIHEVRVLATLVGTSFCVGDSSNEALYVAADSTLTLGHSATITSAGSEPGTIYAAADYISVKLTVPTSGVIGVFYELIDLERDAAATTQSQSLNYWEGLKILPIFFLMDIE